MVTRMFAKNSCMDTGTMKQCLLCFKRYEDIEEDSLPANDLPELYKLCCNYLHSAITKEAFEKYHSDYSKAKSSFCPECFQSAVQLSDLTEQLKIFQKNVTDLLLTFSFGILRRREDVARVEENFQNETNNFIRINVSSFPEFEARNEDSDISSMFLSNEIQTACEDQLQDDLEDCVLISRSIRLENENEIDMENVKIEVLPNEVVGVENSENIIEDDELGGISVGTDGKIANCSLFGSENTSTSKTPVVILERLPFQTSGNISSPETYCDSSKTLESFSLDFRHYANASQNPSSSTQIFKLDTESKFDLEMVNFQSSDLATLEVQSVETLEDTSHNHLTTSSDISFRVDPLDVTKNPWKCSLCERSYTKKKILLRHMRCSHNNVTKKQQKMKKHQCTSCLKMFKLSGDLKRHMLVHTGERPFKCQFCAKQFNLKGNLNKHILVHSGDLLCPFCKKKFSNRIVLGKHIRTHNHKKPCKCGMCEYSCKDRRSMKIY